MLEVTPHSTTPSQLGAKALITPSLMQRRLKGSPAALATIASVTAGEFGSVPNGSQLTMPSP